MRAVVLRFIVILLAYTLCVFEFISMNLFYNWNFNAVLLIINTIIILIINIILINKFLPNKNFNLLNLFPTVWYIFTILNLDYFEQTSIERGLGVDIIGALVIAFIFYFFLQITLSIGEAAVINFRKK